jgi:peptidoglycan/xylan/chitin deacetylase (PgdA/CDA1 family)
MIAGKRRFVARMVERSPVRRLSTWRGALILNYHRVGDPQASQADHSLWSASAEQFDAQLAELARHADIIEPEALEDVVRTGHGRHVLLTFDDGYRDNYDVAFPLLRAHGVRATFFVATGFLDDPRLPWWDEIAWIVRHGDTPARDHAEVIAELISVYKRLPASMTERFLDKVAAHRGTQRPSRDVAAREWMTWDMVREMRAAGMTIGGHTVDHPVLASLPAVRQEREVATCARRLRAELDEPMRLFAYPVGSRTAFTTDTMRILRRHGVRMAFSFYGGYQRIGDWNPLDIPRAHVGPSCDVPMLRAMLNFPQLFARAV